MNNFDKNIRRVLKRFEKSLESELLFDLDDLIDFANGRLDELIEFLKEQQLEDETGILSVLETSGLTQNNKPGGDRRMNMGVNGNTKDEIIKELKEVLKAGKPICIGVAYNDEDEETQDFIELDLSKNQVYLIEGINPNSDSYDLQDDGEILSLPRLKEIINTIAELTLEKNLEKKEIIDWLND